MSTRLVVPDTNILILASQGKFDLLSLFETYQDVLISVVSQVEALGYNFTNPAEEQALRQYFADLTIMSFSAAQVPHAIRYRRQFKTKFPDAAILATARAAGADLLTENTRDFAGRDPAVRVLSLTDLAAL